MKKKSENKTVFLAMSGGVDSSVTAYLLKKQGYQVIGVYMKNWSQESFQGKFAKYCPWKNDLADVKKVCRILDIPHKVYNFEKEYSKKVIDYFFDEELKGKTPNPDVICNREIKFGLFLKRALSEGADLVATGHYARLRREIPNPKSQIPKYKFKLLMAKDKNKDQSYFLCLLNQKQLEKTIFPLGNYTKTQVREIAKKLGFPNAEKPESMGICFVGEVKLEDFLKTRIKETPGDIITTEGKVIGRHIGSPFYTIGQRKGISLAGGPYYVVKKDQKNNQLIVTNNPFNPALFYKEIEVKSVHWISGKAPREVPFSCQVRIRHLQPLQKAIFKKEKRKFIVIFADHQRAVAPGQFCVFYKKNEMLGAGAIVS